MKRIIIMNNQSTTILINKRIRTIPYRSLLNNSKSRSIASASARTRNHQTPSSSTTTTATTNLRTNQNEKLLFLLNSRLFSTTSSNQKKKSTTNNGNDKHTLLEKPDKFRPPSHPSRRVIPGRRSLASEPINYPGPKLSDKEREEARHRHYPHMFPPEGSLMHRFLTNRWIHVWIAMVCIFYLTFYI